MTEPLALSLGQQFELERMNRVIESTADLETLQGLAKQLLQAWQSQRAATQWVMRQQLNGPPGFGVDPAALLSNLPEQPEGPSSAGHQG
ncbi:hypothetical protein [Vulcanococcus limneticus]|uniref:hypothetical protein n=1 Tax=Vulcanococcus limneticus TaxID=2170428 RepID=UPI000B997D75|nr:hypothetical protein [Vulcanococcus limneticus]MCP9792052.1 hypothetical protein [Vulcanococcus limneticus MW73D5]MCP9893085.1 hypothetical protein [Vulcanococcus limneticus Candia 3F8]MCP9897451.1 hypothetical protein [Vulcanococcus limneticus Candia 3B3]